MHTHIFRPTTDEFAVTVVRELTEQECDPEVGRMYEVLVHAYADELTRLPSVPLVTTDGLLDALQDILYPLDQPRDHQWNGGDVCEAVAEILSVYRPEARYRQRAEPVKRFCMETIWEDNEVRLLCCLPLGHGGDHEAMTPPESGYEAFREARKAAGI